MPGYNFTDSVRKTLQRAREETARLHHGFVGTEHILLGLLHDRLATTVLTNLGAPPDALRERVESTLKKGDAGEVGPDFPYTAPAKRILEFSMSEAHELNHSYVGTEHLLLGVLHEGKGIAAIAISQGGITLASMRTEVVRLLGAQPAESSATYQRRSNSGWFVSFSGTHMMLFALVAIALVAWLVSGAAVLFALLASFPPLLLIRRYRSFIAAQFSVALGVIFGALVGSLVLGAGSLGARLVAALLAIVAVAPAVIVLFGLQWEWARRYPRAAA